MTRSIFVILFLSLFFCRPCLAGPPRVIFDQGHGQAFTIEKQGELQLSKLAEKLRYDGWQVASTTTPLTSQSLSGINALIISGAFKSLSASEITTIIDFIHGGGRLAVMLHIATPLTRLLDKLGVTFANGVAREGETSLIIHGEPLNFRTTQLMEHPLNKGLSYVSIYGGWPLLPFRQEVRIIASTSAKAWVDLDRDQVFTNRDAMQEFGVILTGKFGRGEFAIFADDAIFQNQFLAGENEKLADNLSRWMTP